MSKNLNVSLAFTANTNEAIAQIKRLQKELNSLATGESLKNSGITQITPEIQKAISAAGELQAKLESAVNLKTGKLDLTAFSQSLKKGETSLTQYAQQLNALGPAGRQAFTSLAQSVIQAEAPLVRCSNKLRELGTTLANTARWQLSSSILHGFMGSIQSAYGYAEDLNESLNNIRIVTGQNIDQMAKFAVEANKAAKALSTTTTEYTNASLIYYQQGLSDQQVKERTNITIKMANVARQSAEVVSDQMTAIWNNFYDGSKSLEHYADVMTALGAATASSTDEIAGGLEKFSAVAQTIGLSYEYAASALATITSISRESEDVVGTALKTIFARIQGLNLGETLDDGTTLNKYSEALSKVGISIFDQAGDLKNMDTILNEMGTKWETLNAAQKQALAQTVAGVRQYNQLMTLMNNWDSFQANLGVANSSSGALQNQANIYAESWEAARDRVTASAEEIYDKLLNDEFFIDFLNNISKAIDGISNLIDSLGGLRGVLFTIGNIVTKLFQQQMITGLHNAALTAKSLLAPGLVKKQQQDQKDEAIGALQNMKSNAGGATGAAENKALNREVEMQKILMDKADGLSEEELKQLQIQADIVRQMDDRAIAAAKIADEAERELKTLIKRQELEARMRDEAEVNERGRLNAATEIKKALAEGRAGFGQPELEIADEADKRARQRVMSKHNFTNEADLAHYQDEIDIEFTKALREVTFEKREGNDAKSSWGQFSKLINEEVNKARTNMNPAFEMDAKVREQYSKELQAEGKMHGAGRAISETATSLGAVNLKDSDNARSVQNQLADRLNNAKEAARELGQTLYGLSGDTDEVIKDLRKMGEDGNESLKKLVTSLDTMESGLNEVSAGTKSLDNLLEELGPNNDNNLITDIENAADKLRGSTIADAENMMPDFDMSGQFEAASEAEYKKVEKEVADKNVTPQMDKFKKDAKKKNKPDWAESISGATEAIMGVGSAITSVQGLIDVFNNPDASAWEKVSGAMTSLTSIIPAVTSVMSGLSTVMAATGLALGPLLLVIAGIAAAVAVGIAIWKDYNKEAIEAERAAKAAEELAQSVEETKTRVENLKSTFEGYDSAIETLNKCTKGTQEWKDALEDVENEVLNLMTQYPELAKNADLFYRDAETGTLMVNKTAREKLITDAEKAATTAQAASLIGNAVTSKEKADAEKVALQRSGSYTAIGSTYTDEYGQTYHESYLDVSDIAAANAKDLGNLTQDEYSEKMSELIKEKAQSLGVNLDNYESQLNSLVEESKKYQDEVNQLAKSTNEAATQMENAANIIANTHLKDKGYGAAEQEMASEAYEAAVQKEYSAYYDKLTGNKIGDWDGANNAVYEQALKDLQAAGYKYDKQKNNAIRGWDDNRSLAFLDENGQEVVRTAEWIAQTVAANKALTSLGAAAEAASHALNNLDNSASDAMSEGVKSLITNGNFDILSQDERNTMTAEMVAGLTDAEGNAITSIDDMSNQQIADYLMKSMGLTKEQLLQYFNVDSIDALGEKWQTAWDNNATALADSSKNLITNSLKNSFNSLDTSSLDASSKKALADFMNTALLDSGDASAVTDIYSKVKDSEKEKLLDAMGEIDWDNASLDSVKESFKQFGISSQLTDEELTKLIKSMGDAENKTYDYATIMEAVGDLELGGTISAENYAKLGDGMNKYFRQMADGTYQLITDAEKFYEIVKERSVSTFKENIGNTMERINNIKKAQAITKDNSLKAAGIWGTTRGGGRDDERMQNQLDFLKGIGYKENEIKTWEARMQEGSFNATDATALAKAVQDNWSAWDTLGDGLQGQMESVNTEIEKLLSTASNLEDLDELLNIATTEVGENGQVSYMQYAEALEGLASQYNNCATEREAYSAALKNGTQSEIEAAENALKLSIQIGETAAKYGLNAEELEMQASILQSTYSLTQEEAIALAEQNQRMNQGIEMVASNMENWRSVLDNGDTTSQNYAKTLVGMAKAIRSLTGVSEDCEISTDFMTKAFDDGTTALELMEKAANGSEEAIARLGIELAKTSIESLSLTNADGLEVYKDAVEEYTENNTDLSSEELEINVAELLEEEFAKSKDIVINGLQSLQDALQNGDLKVGDNAYEALGGDDWVTALNEMAIATGMSVEQMQNMLNSMGVKAELTTTTKKTKVKVPWYRTQETVHEDGSRESHVVEQGLDEIDGEVEVAQINTGDSIGDKPQITYIGNGNIGSTNLTSGGSPKKLEKTKKSDMLDRYKEINDQLETSRRLMEKAQRAAEGLWGPARIKKMAEATKEMERQNKLLAEKATLAKTYLESGSKSDQATLVATIRENIGSNAGLDYNNLFDSEGNFIGYHEVTDILWANVDAAQNRVKNVNNVTEAEQKAIDNAKEVLQEVLDAMELYDETRQTALDAIAEYERGILNIQQAAFDELTAKMELEIELNDSDLEKLDYYLNKLSEGIWDIGERLTLMVGQLGENGVLNFEDSQLDNYLENLDTYETAYNDLVTKYTTINPETGKTYINQAQFIQGLKDVNSKIYTELGNLQELESTMTSAIADAYAAADETLAKYTDTMSHHISVLDHFMTLMDLLGESKNYEAMRAIAEGQVELAENMATVSKEAYDMKKTALDTQIDRMKEAGFTNDEGEFDLFAISEQDMTEEQRIIREGYQAAVTAAQEAEDQMLADAATWAEALKSLLETELAELADILNKNLSGEFGSLDQLSLAMERKNSLQEEYLTTTNKIYETEKMMRTAQQEIDKTTNSVAKRRLKQFIEETEQLQSQNKLSEHELNIQQAKYDLLLAEIALKEAQNAKSTVRLQRDAEGNFGYVYTADQNKVADAEQKLIDAQNSLYNIGLEGANDYAQKYADTIAEMNDEITALTDAWMNGDIASEEEYRKQKDDIIAHYYEKLNNYSHLYQVSIGVDGRIIEDAWSTQFGNMTSNTEQWMQYVKNYTSQATLAFQEYFAAIEPIAQYTIGKDASDAATKTAEIVTNNQKITEEITKDGGVLDALSLQLHGVSDIVDGYLAMRETIQGAISDAEKLAKISNQTLHNESDNDPNNDLKPENNTASPVEPSTDPGSGAGSQTDSEKELELGSEVKVKSGARWYADSWGGGNSGPAQDGKITIIKEENSHGYHIKGSQYGSGWIKKTDIEGFDTGGYTGAWGSYGKMAMLHEKELVLNQGDTANFLASMEVLERILQILDLQTFSSQMGGLLSSPGFRESGSQNIQQHIEINAEFPNATDRFEIEEAFKSMANLASQYANQK